MSGTNPTRRVLVLAALLTSACASEAVQQSSTDTAADEAAIREIISQEVAALSAGNAAGYVALTGPDFEAMPPNEPAVAGADALTTWLNDFFAAVTAQAQYSNEQITVHGDMAVHRYSGQLTLTPKAGGESMTETIKGLHVFQRQADGTWKMTRDIWNSDVAAEHHAPPTTTAN